MWWEPALSFLGGAGLFLAGVVAPSLKTLTDQLVARWGRKAEVIETRADAAADACLKDLSLIRTTSREYDKLHRAALERDQIERREVARRRHEDAVASLEAHSALLPTAVRTAIAALSPILEYAHDLSQEKGYAGLTFGWHPDSPATIVNNATRYGSELLSAHLRRETLPAQPDPITEYRLAIEDRSGELGDEFAQEIDEADAQLKKFRLDHGLPAERRPWPKP